MEALWANAGVFEKHRVNLKKYGFFSSRFIVGSNRAIFMLRDGGYAWEIKDFLINQERCADVTLEGQVYPGKGADGNEKVKNKTKPEKSKKKKDAEKKSNGVKEDNRATNQREELWQPRHPDWILLCCSLKGISWWVLGFLGVGRKETETTEA